MVLKEAKSYLYGADHEHEEQEAEAEDEVVTRIQEVIYLENEQVVLKNDIYSVTIASILNLYGGGHSFCS